MASESPANDPGTPNANKDTAEADTPPAAPPSTDTTAGASGSQNHPFPFYPGQDGAQSGDSHNENNNTESGGGGVQVPYPPMPVYPYGNVVPGPPPMTRPKRTQCKNACTNCQKACKKCDDNRPCQRCLRYGTAETCVDSKRKERKKGIKRGPYKKRDSRSLNAGDDDGGGVHSANGAHGPPINMPYVGPVAYPTGMWSSYPPTGPNGKLEGGAYYQPVFALTPVGAQPPHGGDGESAGGGSEAPHYPVGYYPTLITLPGPYPPYPMAQGTPPHGFHYPYLPPPGMFQPRPPHANQGNLSGASGSAAEANAKEASGANITEDKKNKEADVEPQVNGKAKAQPQDDDTADKETE
ncbi:hypothetical protein JB92DRAFT_2943263 [Gautieria morchelliformis]|nr:hypothetical protein JB92DRAFT_2943263 [Gautieria morchelliformis]